MPPSEYAVRAGPTVEVNGLSKKYGSVLAVEGVSFTLNPGTITALVGPNGAGKSTLIALMLGIAQPTTGQVQMCGVPAQSAQARRLRAFTLQDSFFPYLLSPRECLRFIGTCYGQAGAGSGEVALLDARELSARRLRMMSGGQRRKVLIAAALEAPPPVLLLDEPTAMLDTDSKRAFWLRVLALCQQGKTIFFTSHNLDEVERHSDRILLMSGGRITHNGTLASISELAGESVVQFSTSAALKAQSLLAARGIRVHMQGETLEFATKEPESALADLFAGAVPVRGLTVQKPSLQVFLDRVGRLQERA